MGQGEQFLGQQDEILGKSLKCFGELCEPRKSVSTFCNNKLIESEEDFPGHFHNGTHRQSQFSMPLNGKQCEVMLGSKLTYEIRILKCYPLKTANSYSCINIMNRQWPFLTKRKK